MIKLILLSLLVSVSCFGQQLVFSPQAVYGKKTQMQLWAVAGNLSTPSKPPTAAFVYGLAAKHGVSFIDPALALAKLNAKDQKSWPAKLFQYGTYVEIGTTEIVNLKIISVNTPISIGLNIAMGITTALLPAIQKSIPVPDATITARVISSSLLMDSNGNVSGLFWAEPSTVQSFTENILPETSDIVLTQGK